MELDDETKARIEEAVKELEKDTEKVAAFSSTPWRYTPEMVVRMMMARMDQIQDIMVLYRLEGTLNPMLVKSDKWGNADFLSFSALLFNMASRDLMVPVKPTDNPPKRRA